MKGKGLLLMVIAVLLAIVLIPIGLIWEIIYCITHPVYTFKLLDNIFYKVALTIDDLGNVACKSLFNWALIKDDNIAPFGNERERISSVIGKNKRANNLTLVGKGLDWILDTIDPNHSIDSIEE